MQSSNLLRVALAALCAAAAVAAPAEPEIRFSSTARPDLDPDHVPSSACVDMLPAHGNSAPSKLDPPYVVEADVRSVVRKGDAVTVSVKGLGDENFLLGLYIQARVNNKPRGHWEPHPSPQVHISDCPPGAQNALSYISRREALNNFAAKWVADGDGVVGDVVFTATIVKRFDVFWVNVTSPAFTVTEN